MPSPEHTVPGYDFVLSSCILLFVCSVSSGVGKKQNISFTSKACLTLKNKQAVVFFHFII